MDEVEELPPHHFSLMSLRHGDRKVESRCVLHRADKNSILMLGSVPQEMLP